MNKVIENIDVLNNQVIIDKIMGKPDYAVAFATWHWPEGGWRAGVTLIDKAWAEDQHLKAACLKQDQLSPEWTAAEGFVNGLNVSSEVSQARAIEKLYESLNRMSKRVELG